MSTEGIASFLSYLLACAALTVAQARAEDIAPLLGSEQSREVFSYVKSKCQDLDIPDAPTRAFRREDGKIVAISASFINIEFVGNSIDTLKRDCSVVYSSSRDPNPAHFDYLTWIASTWTVNGKDIFALGHEEFHGNEVPGACSLQGLRQCWYNSIVFLVSHDGGRRFRKSDKGGSELVFAPFFTNRQAEGEPRGYFNPTNMISMGKHVYVVIGYNGLTKTSHGLCLARSENPFEAGEWEIYRNGQFIKPNANPFSNVGSSLEECSVLPGLDGVVGSINRFRGTDWFVASSITATANGGGQVDLYFSKDLITWGHKQTILNLSTFWSRDCIGGHRYNYPSLLDTNGDSNFSDVGEHPDLYLTRASCVPTLSRDLIAVPIQIRP